MKLEQITTQKISLLSMFISYLELAKRWQTTQSHIQVASKMIRYRCCSYTTLVYFNAELIKARTKTSLCSFVVSLQ